MNEENQTNESEEISANEAEEIKKLLEKNLALTQEIHKMTRQIKRHINFQKVVSFIYILLIVVPIILGIIYLPPLLSGYIKQYQDLLGTDATGGAANAIKNLPAGINLDQIKGLLK